MNPGIFLFFPFFDSIWMWRHFIARDLESWSSALGLWFSSTWTLSVCLLSRCSPDCHSFRADTSDYFHLFPFSLLDAESSSNVSLISFLINVSIPIFFAKLRPQSVWQFCFQIISHEFISRYFQLHAFFVLADSLWLWCRSPDAMFQVYCTGQWFSTTTFTQAACQADVALNDVLYDEAVVSAPIPNCRNLPGRGAFGDTYGADSGSGISSSC